MSALPVAPGQPKPKPKKCGICGSRDIVFDCMLDLNICLKCGAQETLKGWQAR